MTPSEIKPHFLGPLVNTLPSRPMALSYKWVASILIHTVSMFSVPVIFIEKIILKDVSNCFEI